MNLLRNNFAGSFYPNNPVILDKLLEDFLSKPIKLIQNPKAIIVPHAGYIYSGQTAAYGYKQLENENIRTIIILSPAHKVYHQGLAIPQETELETPIGNLQVATKQINELIRSGLFKLDSAHHYQEHSSEVQLPFIKKILPSVKVLPINVGTIDINYLQKAGKELATIFDKNTVIVVSNDLSHYHSLQIAKQLDEKTINTILQLSPDYLLSMHKTKEIECCGIFPIALLLTVLNELKITNKQVLYYDTSATSSFDDKHVVGYTSIAFY